MAEGDRYKAAATVRRSSVLASPLWLLQPQSLCGTAGNCHGPQPKLQVASRATGGRPHRESSATTLMPPSGRAGLPSVLRRRQAVGVARAPVQLLLSSIVRGFRKGAYT
jgi:hypothetical protein